MTTLTTRHRGLAIASGLVFTAGALVILLGDVVATPAAWTITHALTVLTVIGTIAAGHLCDTARAARAWLAAAGFAALFAGGTALVVYQSVGRQAETSDTRTLGIEDRNRQIADKRGELERARQRLADAERQVDLETRGRPDARGRPTTKPVCGRACEDWKLRADEVRSHIATLEGDVARLGSPLPVAPKAEKMAAVVALLGADEAKAKAALQLLEPFLWTLFFEIGSVVSWGFAFRRRRTSAADRAQTDFGGWMPPHLAAGEPPEPPSGPRPGTRQHIATGRRVAAGSRNESRHAPTKDSAQVIPFVRGPGRESQREAVLAAITAELAAGRAFPSQRDLCARYGVARSTMSDWLGAWEAAGAIPPRRITGRTKRLASL